VANHSSTLTGWFSSSVGVPLIGICHDDYQYRCTVNVDYHMDGVVTRGYTEIGFANVR